MNPTELGVNQVASKIHTRLRRYLEAQYHVRETGIINERLELLNEAGGISQRPFIEVTPSYAVRDGFDKLNIPATIRALLGELAQLSIGVYPPYQHQAEALERFFGSDANDLIVATGTGSGKTETFLYAVLGMLALEATERPTSFRRSAVRSLLLYPMNALVSDQTARLRRLLGDVRVASKFHDRWGRHPRFGMYTSRTPYPGVRTGTKDGRYLQGLVGYFEELATRAENEEKEREARNEGEDKKGFSTVLVEELQRRGRWPAKDVVKFYARDREEQTTYKSGKRTGKPRTLHHWDERFNTDPLDRELLTRHEIQAAAPDLLVTNYSMLEYMLLRPIERPLFASTKQWLAADERNQLVLILDEAHMYRGVGGAEVSLLIRRLTSRLGIGRDRLRCILTSASLGSEAEAEKAGKAFARAITGDSAKRSFAVVQGTREARPKSRPGTAEQARALIEVRGAILGAAAVVPEDAHSEILKVSERLNWGQPPSMSEAGGLATRQFVARALTGFGPLELLISIASGKARPFEELARDLFPEVPHADAERATDGLLALGSFSRRFEPGRAEQPLIPTRVHMIFRGLPALFACIDPRCSARRHRPREQALVGRVFTEPRTQCECGGRVFELLTHRDCGAAYLRAFGIKSDPDFLWHERGGTLREFGEPLHELHLLLEDPHPKAVQDVTPILVDIKSGRLIRPSGQEVAGTRLVYTPRIAADVVSITTFGACPCCLRKTITGGGLKIMDLATKGEQPFANLVREQFVSQAETRQASERYPNEGRKALLFSDGRQKAARLARDLPREVERDSFREAIVLAVDSLRKLSRESVLDDQGLYPAFVAVCAAHHLHFFDRTDQRTLLEECARFRKDYGGELDTALDSGDWKPTVPTRYRQILLRQIGDPYYSIVSACAAVVEPKPSFLRRLQNRLGGVAPDLVRDLADAWSRAMLARGAFDPALSKDSRQDEFPYFEPVRMDDGLKRFFEDLRERSGVDSARMVQIRSELFDVFTREAADGDDQGRLLVPNGFVLRLTLDDTWMQCRACGHLQLRPFCGVCVNCGDGRLDPRPPSHEYIRTRKGFFREPLLAVLRGEKPIHITAEEHTAQLSQRDAGVVYATTEEFELRFQDVPLGPTKPPIDILSCTTTMEVGIDIGSLTAVGLRTVPPQRENYQQRAGRAGRRGTSVSSVVTYAQGGAHDSFYFENPAAMISGPPREPRVKTDNRRLAARHINSYLLQTFFHGQIDRLPPAEQQRLAKKRPGIMAAFGTVREFFDGDGPFSFDAFEDWLRKKVLVPKSVIIEEIASWLPPEISKESDTLEDRRRFARETAERLLGTLGQLRRELAPVAGAGAGAEGDKGDDDVEDNEEPGDDGSEAETLLDLLFDRGLLPSYAFPTGLSSFVIQDWVDGKVQVRERPQLAKAQALSEYAPGRLLVVNKQTYRVGGLLLSDAPTTGSPAAPMFSGRLRRYVGCQACTFVSLEEGVQAPRFTEGTPCPVCDEPLLVREFIDPPAFSPERGRPVAETDRDQEITFASSAQLPELVDQEKFRWQQGAGKNLSHAYGEDVLLVVANKGRDGRGFSVCELCGAACLDGDEPPGAHARPFLIPQYVLQREQLGRQCQGSLRRGLFLGHEFRTDVLLLRIPFRDPLDFDPKLPWLYDALATLSEAIALAASLHLDIDPGELSAGFRLLPRLEEDHVGVGELYVFDTASGGAGYAADAGESLSEILVRANSLLTECPGRCERSCTKCLRHYGNRFLHTRLDRRLARMLLDYAREGRAPTIAATPAQATLLAPLARFLQLEGWNVAGGSDDDTPLVVTDPAGNVAAVGAYPALVEPDAARQTHPLSRRSDMRIVLLPDQLVERDLPSARRLVSGDLHLRGRSGSPSSSDGLPTIECPTTDLRAIELDSWRKTGTVRLPIPPVVDGYFAVRTPSGALGRLGLPAGSWLVVRKAQASDVDDKQSLLILRARGNFRATSALWTIAKVRRLDDAEGRMQVSYGRKEAEFRPERLSKDEITIAAAVVHAGVFAR